MAQKFYLIDFENANTAEKLNFKEAADQDIIYIFYTENSKRIDLDLLQGVQARIVVFKVPSGKQSLDMHLISYLGYLIGLHHDQASYVICSKDNDYSGPIAFWKKEEGLDIELRLLEKPAEEAEKPEKAVKETLETSGAKQASDKTVLNNRIIQTLVSGNTDPSTAGAIASLTIKQYGKDNFKSLVYRGIIQAYGQKQGLELYGAIKSIL